MSHALSPGLTGHPLRAKMKEAKTEEEIAEILLDGLFIHIEYGAAFWPILDGLKQDAERRRSQIGSLTPQTA